MKVWYPGSGKCGSLNHLQPTSGFVNENGATDTLIFPPYKWLSFTTFTTHFCTSVAFTRSLHSTGHDERLMKLKVQTIFPHGKLRKQYWDESSQVGKKVRCVRLTMISTKLVCLCMYILMSFYPLYHNGTFPVTLDVGVRASKNYMCISKY